MNNAAAMRGVECIGNLDTHLQHLLNLERTPFDLVPQGGPVQVLHGDERLPRFLADVVNGADVGMVQGRSRLGFPLKTGQGLGISGNILWEELEGDKAVQPGIFSLINDAHAAATDLLNDAVMRDGAAYHWRTMLLVVKPASQRRPRSSTRAGLSFGGCATSRDFRDVGT